MFLPVIIANGGINAAGRGSFGHSFKWTIFNKLSAAEQLHAVKSQLCLSGRLQDDGVHLLLDGKEVAEKQIMAELPKLMAGSMIRKVSLSESSFEANQAIQTKQPFQASTIQRKGIEFPSSAKILDQDNNDLQLNIGEGSSLFLRVKKNLEVNSAGQTPDGFDPARLYNAVNHPRALQLAIYAMSDCLHSCGLTWDEISKDINNDKIGVYASSMLGNIDSFGAAGYLQARLAGKRPNGKTLPLSMPQMVADFINAYVLDNIGHTSTLIGACATFLYNLQAATQDIQSGRRTIAIVGATDAPVTTEVIEAYMAMTALSTDELLRSLDGLPEGAQPNFARACRPFAENCGFVLGESSQFFILCESSLALKLGANIMGSVGGVYINADGYKSSISKPGPGNLFSLFQALALAKSVVGEDKLQNQTFVSAHGTGTPLNRVSESKLLSTVAGKFGVKNWPISAIKCRLGHSTGAAAADQLSHMLGTFFTGWVPAISTIDKIAADVVQNNLNFCLEDHYLDPSAQAGGFINSKGFGGNNATAFILSPAETMKIIKHKHTSAEINSHAAKLEDVQTKAKKNENLLDQKKLPILYDIHASKTLSGEPEMSATEVSWGGYKVGLTTKSPYL